MRTQAAVASKKTVGDPRLDDDGRIEEISALSSQVSSAFGELTRVQAELAERMEVFKEREAELEEQRAALEKERDEHETRVARAERIARQADAREDALQKRDDAVTQREQATKSFQDLLVRMVTALDDPTPTNLSDAFEAAQISLKEGHAALGARASIEVEAETPSEEEVVVSVADAAPADVDPSVDLKDFSEEELRKLGMLQKLGTASTAEIADQIRAERDGSGEKKKGWFS